MHANTLQISYIHPNVYKKSERQYMKDYEKQPNTGTSIFYEKHFKVRRKRCYIKSNLQEEAR